MSTLRQLVHNQISISPSMESRRISEELEWMAGHLQQHITAYNNVLAGDASMESSDDYVTSMGYSTEAADRKTLLQRIWEGIKRIYGQIKEWISRLLSARKHHLQHNQFQIDKVRGYVKNLDMTLTPTGQMQLNLTLLPDNPADAHSKLHLFRDQVRNAMTVRNDALVKLGGMDFTHVTPANADEQIHSVVNRSMTVVSARSDQAALTFNFLVNKMGFEVKMSAGGTTSQQPASIVLMNTLIRDYDDLVADDKKFLAEIEKHSTDSDKALNDLKKIVEAIEKESDHVADNEPSVEGWLERRKEANEKVAALSKIMAIVARIQKITHMVPYDTLCDDVLTILQRSLGQYKLKKQELNPEDRTGDHEYR